MPIMRAHIRTVRIRRTAAAICAILMPLALTAMSPAPVRGLLWPIDRPQRITGTFCEPRGSRFHLGIDVSTAGKKGFAVNAADDGYVSTVMYQKWGIGYALFITHPDGRKTFYGHLDGFADRVLGLPAVARYGENIMDRKDFTLELESEAIPVRRGELVGFSGDSGIGREHFHFEVRDEGGVHLNPLRYGLTIQDDIPPEFFVLGITALDGRSHVNGQAGGRVLFPVIKSPDGIYRPVKKGALPAGGVLGFSVTAGDRAGYTSRLAVYRIELHVDGRRFFETRFDRMRREETHHMGLHYDYSATDGTRYTHFLYSRTGDEGRIDTGRLGRSARVSITASDASDNSARLEFDLAVLPALASPVGQPRPNLEKGRKLHVKSEDGAFEVIFESKAALYTEHIWLREDPSLRIAVKGLSARSGVYTVFPEDLCVDRPMKISITYRGEDRGKVGVYRINPSTGRFHFAGGLYDSKTGSFKHESYRTGGFFLLRDDEPPVARFKQAGPVSPERPLFIAVSDTGCGVDLSSVELTVDGKPVKWDYDPDYSRIEILRHNRIWSRGKHTIELRLRDGAGNEMKRLSSGYVVR
jgi:hypothetical protein